MCVVFFSCVLYLNAHSKENKKKGYRSSFVECDMCNGYCCCYRCLAVAGAAAVAVTVTVALAVGDFVDTTTSYASVNIYQYSTCVS